LVTRKANNMHNDHEEWVPIAEAAQRLGMNRSRISRLIQKGEIQSKLNRLDHRIRLINLTELRALLEEYGPQMDDES
jgi:hypothetical protein